jgi:hypothetical protein
VWNCQLPGIHANAKAKPAGAACKDIEARKNQDGGTGQLQPLDTSHVLAGDRLKSPTCRQLVKRSRVRSRSYAWKFNPGAPGHHDAVRRRLRSAGNIRIRKSVFQRSPDLN